jgi:hypothetical protein
MDRALSQRGFEMLHGDSPISATANWIQPASSGSKTAGSHCDVIQDEATREESNSGLPIFKAEFPSYHTPLAAPGHHGAPRCRRRLEE